MITTQNIQQVINNIQQFYKPEKIMLFGSAAANTMTEDSDIDLIVIKQTNEPKHTRSAAIYKHLMSLKMPLDIMVYTPQEYNIEANNPYSFLHNALINSRVVYER